MPPSIETAIDLARTHLTEARRSVGTLRPNVGNGEDIATALKRLADLGSAPTDVPIDLVVDELPRFGDGVEREIIGNRAGSADQCRASFARAPHHDPRLDRAVGGAAPVGRR